MSSSEAVVRISDSSKRTLDYLIQCQNNHTLNPGFKVNIEQFQTISDSIMLKFEHAVDEYLQSLLELQSNLSLEEQLVLTKVISERSLSNRSIVPILLKYYGLENTVRFRQKSPNSTELPEKYSSAQQYWRDLVSPDMTVLVKLLTALDLFYPVKRIRGSKTEDTGFLTKLTDSNLVTPISFHPTRSYHEYLYSLPYELRACLYSQDGSPFYYLDLHAAELCFYSNISKDSKLLRDINSTEIPFWNRLLSELGYSDNQLQDTDIFSNSKEICKKNVYSIIYSLSPNSMLPFQYKPDNQSNKDFMMWFLNRYPNLRTKLLQIKNSGNTIQLWEGTQFNLENHHNLIPAKLNYTAQAGLTYLTYRVIANLLHSGITVYTFNFDSILFTGDPVLAERVILDTYKKYGFVFTFNITSGQSYKIAQLGE